MRLCFSKYEGCGNDFILIDDRNNEFPANSKLIKKLCHRQLGVGADGVILLQNSSQADYTMRIFNADGSEAEMCGNGLRCFGKFLHELGITSPTEFKIDVYGKILTLRVEEDSVRVGMSDPSDMKWRLNLEGFEIDYLDTGVPHAVLFVEDIEKIDLVTQGRKLRYHSEFAPRGTNVNFAQVQPDGVVLMRTYERGVEDETLACGTGATAVAIAANRQFGLKAPVAIRTRSGAMLQIDFDKNINCVTMSGPASLVFQGALELKGQEIFATLN